MKKHILKNKLVKAGIVSSLLVSSSAFAESALPPGITTAFTNFLAQITELETLAWTVVPMIVGSFIVIKLFKRFSKAAT